MKKINQSVTLLIIIISIFAACLTAEKTERKKSEVNHPDWTRNAVIYEVNVRQYSPEGTFKAFEKDLQRLKELGIDILWLMPIHPIGEKNRKGPLGSYYSVKDFKEVNPEYGTMDDFKDLVKSVHGQGMKIIIDWVPNHSSWDNPLTVEHPEYYMKDSAGNYVSPFDWTDVIRFDYTNDSMRKYMTETMKWWISETDIDGYRCDVAHMVPVDYWEELMPELNSVKPVFMLAESDQPELHDKAFDMTYDWKLHHIFNQVAKNEKSPYAIAEHFHWVDSVYAEDSYLMQFTSNHDENSWNGTEFERMGEGAKAYAVLAATLPDMLLIYNGQESAFNERLKFFEKDTIDWGDYSYTGFYKSLTGLKDRNKAIYNGNEGGKPEFLTGAADSLVFAFKRESGTDKILVVCNLRDTTIQYKLNLPAEMKNMKEIFTNKERSFKKETEITLTPWQFMVFEGIKK